ncbi:MAG TPA: hypothetical protein VFP84_30795 [Kofleriaceae bacterium]|nr:hypothetical protein [Kofleriaceae bacterium]
MAPHPQDPRDRAILAGLARDVARAIAAALTLTPGDHVCFLDGGIAVSAEHLRWATQAPPFAGTAEADDARSFARIANTLPRADAPWSASPHALGELYRRWLETAQVPAHALGPDDTRRLEQALATIQDLAAAYREHQQRWAEAERAWQAVARAAATVPDRSRQLLACKAALSTALQVWQTRGHKARFEAAVAERQAHAERGLPRMLAALRARYDHAIAANRGRDGEGFTPVTLSPPDLFDRAAAWTPIALRTEGEVAASAHDPSHGGADLLWWTRQPGEPCSAVARGETRGVALSFDLACARVDREPWFDSYLLTSRSWWWPGASRAAPEAGGPLLSSGDPPPTTRGAWPLTPTAVVFAKNLRIDADVTDRTVLRARLAAAPSAGLVCFTLRNAPGSPLANGHDLTMTASGQLVVAQPQIIAVVCQRMPKEPDPDLALLPG